MEVLLTLFTASATGFGIFAGVVAVERYEALRRSRSLRSAMGYEPVHKKQPMTLGTSRLHTWLIEKMILSSRGTVTPPWLSVAQSFWTFGLGQVEEVIEKAGLADVVTKQGVVIVRAGASCALALGGGLLGVFFSEILAFLLACVGFLYGFSAPLRALKEEKRERSFHIEKQLSQMIEVLVLGLCSGMSFDRSLELYRQYFDGGLSRSLALAQQQWTHGLLSRDQSLRRLARSCDSLLFGRAVESVIRSLRFGTSLAEGLSMLAVEARSVRKSKLEERIAKAPIKMLLPVGGLILPAMLILILGPVLLDLMAGF